MNVKLTDLFTIEYPKQMIFSEQEINDKGINFISSKGTNNGVVSKITMNLRNKIYSGGAITVPLKGTVLQAFYQKENFQVAHQIAVLYPKYKMSEEKMFFYVLCIRNNKYRFNYGRQADKTLEDVLLPKDMPKLWDKISLKDFNKVEKEPLNNKYFELSISSWQNYKLSGLFKIEGSVTTPKLELEEYGFGKYPFVTTQATNNGIESFYNHFTEKGNVLVVDSAVIGYCSYQPFDFSASDHVEKLIPKFEMSKYTALFLTTILNKEQYRYNYGRKASQSRLEQRSIKLPSKNNQPDWNFMEDYMKSLSYSVNL